jgi:hypothetical protein
MFIFQLAELFIMMDKRVFMIKSIMWYVPLNTCGALVCIDWM